VRKANVALILIFLAMCVQDLVTGCCVAVLLVCSAHAQAVKDYSYPVLWTPNTIVTTTVDYTDGPAKLRVCLAGAQQI
jgi:hypothetical protein